MIEADRIVIVGGGHAAAQLCGLLATAGLGARVHLVCAEDELPYQRPPLSKSFLKNSAEQAQPFRAEAWYLEAGITLHRGDAALEIDRAQRTLRLRSGRLLGYGQLVLATGARARWLPQWPQGLANLATLRSAADAARLRTLLAGTTRLTVLGGGFIGLEIAAAARALGKEVVVLESAPRLLARSVSAELADFVLATHRASGIDMRLGAAVTEFEIDGEGEGRRMTSLVVDGRSEPVELLVLGVGAEPETALASAAGLTIDVGGGVHVDEFMRSSDPAILAIGDIASFPAPGGQRLRLESVPNANDQARTAAATLAGRLEAHRALPSFWSEQGGLRLQMAGLLPAGASSHRRPGATPASFSLLHYLGAKLVCVESANAPMDHMAARKLLEAGRSPEPAAACDGAVPLKSFI
jgi:3-phenylpropionate/trans-cinnamate dioxygenase ferredoxin reductase component